MVPKAVVFSIGEPTTDLCRWSLERNGFKVEVWQDDTSLWAKLKRAYNYFSEDFLRVDADIVPNRNLSPELLAMLSSDKDIWWWQFQTFCWFKQDITHSVAFIRTPALPHLRDNIDKFEHDLRPETQASRIKRFHEPRRMMTYEDEIVGLHGYGTKDLKSAYKLKANRGQSHLYDFELAQRLNEL